MLEEIIDGQGIEEKYDEVIPTLFIALGGTGAEVLWRIRRRILNTLWGSGSNSVRLASLAKFPLAEFLQIDLDVNSVTQRGKAIKSDILANKVVFKEEEKIVNTLVLSNYSKTDEELEKYPLIQEWFPLSRTKLNELNLNVEDGAGQIRAISRLYFFDQYAEIKTRIRNKADRLLANMDSAASANSLGLTVKGNSLKIVVVASTAGGTGSGSFLDLGYLTQIIGKDAVMQGRVSTKLVLMLPTGYKGANVVRTQANTYAALMEMETCMSQGLRYINKWTEYDNIEPWPDAPYNDAYLVDTKNLAGASTENIVDLYEMIADVLFEDFSTSGLANNKRMNEVNQSQHKSRPFVSLVSEKKYGDMKLTFTRRYSSFGQSTIDTHLEQKKNIILFRQVNGMLKAFFGLATDDIKSNVSTEGERDELLAKYMHLGIANEIINYDFVVKHNIYRKGTERTTFPLVTELLRVKNIVKLDDIEKGIADRFEDIRTGGNYKEWPGKIAEAIADINHDVFKEVESSSGLHEDAICMRRDELLKYLINPDREDGLIKALWERINNKERGGLDYTVDLIIRIKDRLENSSNGLIEMLKENAKWFSDLSGFLRNDETDKLQEHLREAISQLLGSEKQSNLKLKQISDTVKLYVRYHLYATASREAAVLVKDLSEALGKQQGTDANGNPTWSGFIGSLEEGRNLVRAIISEAEEQIARTNEAMKQGHAMYFVLPAPRSRIDDLELLSHAQARQWAEEAFKDFGGTEHLFKMLKDEKGRSELIDKLRNRALNLIEGDRRPIEEENPLFDALEQYSNKNQLFKDFIQRAMPWAAVKVDYLKKDEPHDQYRCLIGVKNARRFELLYRRLLEEQLPASATKMTVNQLAFVEIDTPGKLVCYVELTGIPLPSLKGLGEWYSAYLSENNSVNAIPVHTHRRPSTFIHPRELTLDELASRVEDIKLFIQAVALGVLNRSKEGTDLGLYKIRSKGRPSSVGDEKYIRLQGITKYRDELKSQVRLDRDLLTSNDQLAIWVALLLYYQNFVYPLKEVLVSDVLTDHIRALPTLVCEQLVDDWTNRLINKLGKAKTESMLRLASESLDKWTDEIPGSTSDVYLYELNNEDIRPKRVLLREVLQPDWALGTGAGNGGSSCSSCGEQVEGNPKFCPHCGNLMKSGKKCSGCGCAIEGNPKFCPECGIKQGGGTQCGSCGYTIEGSPKFCPECGKPV